MRKMIRLMPQRMVQEVASSGFWRFASLISPRARPEMTSTENTAVSEYETESKENAITKATKDQDVKYKTKEFKGLDKASTEATADKAGVQEELDAVNQYYSGIKARCIAKAETYAERVKRREAEIAGLKEALTILEGEAVLLQRKSKHTLRGAHA